MVEGDGLQKKGFGWRTGARLCSSLSPLPSPLLRTPAPPLTRPVHRARRGACVPPASRHLEQTKNIKSAQPQITCERSKVTTDKYAKTQTIRQNKSRDVRMRIRVHKHTERLQTLRGRTYMWPPRLWGLLENIRVYRGCKRAAALSSRNWARVI